MFNFKFIAPIICSYLVFSGAAWAQGQPTVAIAKIDDNAGSGQSKTLTQMMLTALASTQKFRVMEREQLDALMQEQQRAKAGQVKSRNGGEMGGFEGADYLV